MIRLIYKQSFQSFFILLFVIGAGLNVLQAQNKASPLQELRERFRSGKVFHAQFNHLYKDSYTGNTQQSSGEVWVGGNEYRVVSENQRVLVYEGLSRVYDENRNRVIISKYEPQEDDFAPSKFLTGTDTLYTVANQVTNDDSVKITLRSNDPFTVFKSIHITLDPSLTPLRIQAVDQADNKVVTRFKEGTFIDRRDDIFDLNYPEDAKIIDLRE